MSRRSEAPPNGRSRPRTAATSRLRQLTQPGLDIELLRQRMREAFERSGLTLSDLGKKMGLDPDRSRQSVWNLLNRSEDPSLSRVFRFCRATGITIDELLTPARTSTKH